LQHFRSLLNISVDQFYHLISTQPHSPYLHRHRLSHIIGRIQLLSFIFAIVVPLWSIVDFFVFPYPEWLTLTVMRVVSAGIFALLAWPWRLEVNAKTTYTMMTLMLIGPPAFYFISLPLFSGLELDQFGRVAVYLYGLLPFIVLAGLSVFPLTLLELLTFGTPFLAIAAYGTYINDGFSWEKFVGMLWLAMLLFGASIFSSMSLLRYMIALVSRASQDPLTKIFTRESGSEMIDIQFRVAVRQHAPFTILFFDIDNFKAINDTYGHEEGDKALCAFVDHLREKLRNSDTMVRWGGEEFLVALPNTDKEGARLVIVRILENWLGTRPDGRPLTASIGVTERMDDSLEDWHDLIELADQRMYQAKQAGRSRAVFSDTLTIDGTPAEKSTIQAAQ